MRERERRPKALGAVDAYYARDARFDLAIDVLLDLADEIRGVNDAPAGHPLDDEDVEITVGVRHLTTGIAHEATGRAPADGPPTVTEALSVLCGNVMDEVLREIEER